jgi:hypothetical protein
MRVVASNIYNMDGQSTKDAFYDEWIKQIRKGFGHMKAYNNVEIMHINQYGKERYSDYKSFRSANKGR